MKTYQKILFTWLGFITFFAIGFQFYEHKEIQLSGLINLLAQSLLMVICYFLIKNLRNTSNKYIFINFFLFFSSSILAYVHLFIGKAFLNEYRFAAHYYFQYYSSLFVFTLAFSVIYLVIDTLLLNLKVFKKYLISFSICFIFFSWYFYPILSDPLYLYKTEEIHQWKTLANYVEQSQTVNNIEDLSHGVTLQSWENNRPIGALYPEENLSRIEELLPYLEGENYRTLLFQPLYSSIINIEVMIIGFVILFFGYQYKKEPPQGAYMDKIVFALLLFVSTDILHYWGYMKSVEWNSLTEFFTIGQYISNIILLVLVALFSLRLKFVLSPQGSFYETELASNPKGISRWRDGMDEYALSKFFKTKTVQGRLFEKSINNN